MSGYPSADVIEAQIVAIRRGDHRKITRPE